MAMQRWCVFVVLLHYTSARVVRPNMKTQECLKTSHYLRDPNEYVCKDLGLCYKHYCKAPARKCFGCDYTRKPSCLLAGNEAQNISSNLKKKPKPRIRNPEYENCTNCIHGVLRIKAGDRECLGFLAAVPNAKQYRLVVVTAASCVSRFKVTCAVPNTANNESHSIHGSAACFGNPDTRIDQVSKGFRSYCATITNNGSTVTVPLNNEYVLIPRQYIECGDCLYDIAVIKLRANHLRDLKLTSENAHVLQTISKPKKIKKTPFFVGYNIPNSPDFNWDSQRIFFSTEEKFLSQKMCMDINSTDIGEYIVNGSPVLYQLNSSSVATNVTFQTAHTVAGVLSYVRPLGTGVTRASVVRITEQLVDFIWRWLKVKWTEDECSQPDDRLNAKYDCYPSFKENGGNNSLCLCARGWKNERGHCKTATSEGLRNCVWDKTEKIMTCTGSIMSESALSSQVDMGLDTTVLPGSTKHLTFLSHEIKDGVELQEVLRHLPNLKSLEVEHANLQTLSISTFQGNPLLQRLSLSNNNLSRVNEDLFIKQRNLLSLNLANNRLHYIPRRVFRKQLKLRELNARGNEIERIATRALRKNIKLQRIRLSRNRITTIPSTLFKTNTDLREVYLDHNHITEISGTTFRNCHRLKRLNVEGNQLTNIPRELFLSNIRLTVVNLGKNRISNLPHDLFDNQLYLEEVWLNENPELPSTLTLGAYVSQASINRLKHLLEVYSKP
ncbi:uncharacterized protein LOC100181791 [Ciona intestinalis]